MLAANLARGVFLGALVVETGPDPGRAGQRSGRGRIGDEDRSDPTNLAGRGSPRPALARAKRDVARQGCPRRYRARCRPSLGRQRQGRPDRCAQYVRRVLGADRSARSRSAPISCTCSARRFAASCSDAGRRRAAPGSPRAAPRRRPARRRPVRRAGARADLAQGRRRLGDQPAVGQRLLDDHRELAAGRRRQGRLRRWSPAGSRWPARRRTAGASALVDLERPLDRCRPAGRRRWRTRPRHRNRAAWPARPAAARRSNSGESRVSECTWYRCTRGRVARVSSHCSVERRQRMFLDLVDVGVRVPVADVP